MKSGVYLILLSLTTGTGISMSASAEPLVTNYKQYTRLSQENVNGGASRFESLNVVKKYNEDDDEYEVVNDRSYEKDGLRFAVRPNVITGSSPQTLYRYIGKAKFEMDSFEKMFKERKAEFKHKLTAAEEEQLKQRVQAIYNMQKNRPEPKRHWAKGEDWRSNHQTIVVGNRIANMPGRTGDYFFGEEEVTCAEAQKTEVEKFLASSAGARLKRDTNLGKVTVYLGIVAAPGKKSTPASLAEAEGLGGWKPARFEGGELIVSPVFQNVQKRTFLGVANNAGVGDFKYVESNCFVSPAADIEKAVADVLEGKRRAVMAGRGPEAAKMEGQEWDRQREQLQWRSNPESSVVRRNRTKQ